MFYGLVVLVIIGGWLGTLMLGSIMALRGARNWTTILQLCGSGTMLIGGVLYGLSLSMYTSSYMTYSPGGSSTGYPEFARTWELLMAAGGIGFLGGLILFTGGYMGMCAKYGAVHHRSRELEGLVQQLQDRIQSPTTP